MRSTRAVAMLLAAGMFSPEANAQLLSPGELSKAHASLDGDDKCSECHAEAAKIDDNKCLGCHKELAARVRTGAGLHGKTHRGEVCEKCHVEHNGRKYQLIRWPDRSMDNFDHTKAGWKLEGKHASIDCAQCHKAKTKSGTRTFLGLGSDCTQCHKDPHDARFGPRCTQCHDQNRWRPAKLEGFDHNLARFPLKGKHAKVECAKCHKDPPRFRGLKFDDCSSCHKDPHGKRFKQTCGSCHIETGWNEVSSNFRHPGLSLAGGHRTVDCAKCHDRGNTKRPSKGRECRACHPPVHQAKFGLICESCHESIRWLDLPRKIGLDAHPQTSFELTGKHIDAECAGCHPTSKPVNARYRELAFDRCDACHKDPHQGRLAARGDCAACHGTGGFAPASFGTEAHATARFPLEGRHQAVACAACHAAPRPRVDFRVTKSECADCHENPHGGQFAKEMAQGGCARCHSATGWKMPKFEHGAWPLTGAHGRTPCARCHGSVKDPGRVDAAAYRGVPRVCEGCHADVHAGQFRLTPPTKACEACHTTERFQLTFDHGAQTGFAIDGRHEKVDCEGCHPVAVLASGREVVRYRLGYRRCRDCHADPHGGTQ